MVQDLPAPKPRLCFQQPAETMKPPFATHGYPRMGMIPPIRIPVGLAMTVELYSNSIFWTDLGIPVPCISRLHVQGAGRQRTSLGPDLGRHLSARDVDLATGEQTDGHFTQPAKFCCPPSEIDRNVHRSHDYIISNGAPTGSHSARVHPNSSTVNTQ